MCDSMPCTKVFGNDGMNEVVPQLRGPVASYPGVRGRGKSTWDTLYAHALNLNTCLTLRHYVSVCGYTMPGLITFTCFGLSSSYGQSRQMKCIGDAMSISVVCVRTYEQTEVHYITTNNGKSNKVLWKYVYTLKL